MKRCLFVLRRAAHVGSQLQEMLDMAMTVAAFDNPTSILLLDDAVYHLKKNQQPSILGLKDTATIFTALELYDIHPLYVEIESLDERGLSADDLILSPINVRRTGIAALLQEFDLLIPD